MWGKIICGAIGSFFGPLGAGIGIAIGEAIDSENSGPLFTNDFLDLNMKILNDTDGVYLFVEAQNNIPSTPLMAVVNIIDRDDSSYIKVKKSTSIPPVLTDNAGDFSASVELENGHGIFYIPFDALSYSSSGSYKVPVTVVKPDSGTGVTLVGREIFNLELPQPRNWYRSAYFRPLIGLLMAITRAEGELTKPSVRKVREFIEGPLEVTHDERDILKEIIKAEPSNDLDSILFFAIHRYHYLETSDLFGILSDFTLIDDFATDKRIDFLQAIADRLGTGIKVTYKSLRQSHYQVLGLQPGASVQDINAAYRSKIKEYHPDRVANLPAEFQKLAHEKSIAITDAYNYLKNV